MHQELTEATNFMGRLLQSKLDPSLITIFTDKLYGLLSERFVDHWDVDCPYRGNAYRAISIFNGQLDPLLALAAQEVSLPPTALLIYLPQEFVLWIDPSSVSYRVGDHGNIMDLYVNGKSLKDRKSIITNAASTSTPIRISPPTSPAAIEKKLQQQHHQQQHQPLQPSSPLAIHAKREQQKQKQQQSQQQPTTPRHKSLVLAH
ncbi:hypothetical protein [Absidia glauca]|uniref:Anti-proliferative protein domain-containing protein n=1 Tax=Absidia glauca TaxID=4829 RepID=A0A168SWC5_ABSGL|nr:hypothetical protein [Absidia glauca]